MKKMVLTFFIILFLPINVFAYSKNIIPGGESIGIKIESDGLIVVGFYQVDGKYLSKGNLKIGDSIIEINNKKVNSIDELTDIISTSNINNGYVNVKVKRNNKEIKTKLNLIESNGIYKTGLYIKDNIVGLGTLTYIDPITKTYGALGHEIILNETNKKIEVRDGNILLSKVKSIDKSKNGYVGSKNASIFFNKKIGTIEKNTDKGIFGKYESSLPNKKTYEISTYDEIKIGEAKILTVTKNSNINEYKINILEKYSSKKNTAKAFSFEIIDKKLLNETGGIVQGMSGSPIIQNNKIIGAVTNVLVDKVNLGYGIPIITMLEEGEK